MLKCTISSLNVYSQVQNNQWQNNVAILHDQICFVDVDDRIDLNWRSLDIDLWQVDIDQIPGFINCFMHIGYLW